MDEYCEHEWFKAGDTVRVWISWEANWEEHQVFKCSKCNDTEIVNLKDLKQK